MNTIRLRRKTEAGQLQEATFCPDKGMNMLSFKCADQEIMDQSTWEQFEKKAAGLGALIGPHFHTRSSHLIPKSIDYTKIHSKNLESPDPFSHGVGRYASWKVDFDETSFQARLSGKDTLDGIPLKDIEGQNFEMYFNGELESDGMHFTFSVVSDTDSIVGLHYYYALANGEGTVISQVQNSYIVNNEKRPLPKEWERDSQGFLTYPLTQDTDFTFFPYPNPLKGKMVLDTKTHKVIVTYSSASEENSWQLWHPKNASFVCIEPVSAKNPRRPNLSVSSFNARVQITLK